jgi:hypothetical protein
MARVDYLVGKIGIQAHPGRQGHRHVGGNTCTEELPSVASVWCRARRNAVHSCREMGPCISVSTQQKQGLTPCSIMQALTHDGTSQQAAGSSCGHKTLACGILHAISKLERRADPVGFPGRCVHIQVPFTLQSVVRQERSNSEEFTTQAWKPGSVKRHSKLLSGPCKHCVF